MLQRDRQSESVRVKAEGCAWCNSITRTASPSVNAMADVALTRIVHERGPDRHVEAKKCLPIRELGIATSQGSRTAVRRWRHMRSHVQVAAKLEFGEVTSVVEVDERATV